MKPDKTAYARGKRDGWVAHLAGSTSYFIESDHLLVVDLVFLVHTFKRIFFDEVLHITFYRKKNYVRFLILMTLVLLLLVIFWSVSRIAEGEGNIIMVGLFLLPASILSFRSIYVLVSGELHIRLTAQDGYEITINFRKNKRKEQRFSRKLLALIESYQRTHREDGQGPDDDTESRFIRNSRPMREAHP